MELKLNHDQGIMAAGCVMALATFMPIVRIPIMGTVSYFQNGRVEGVVTLALAAARSDDDHQ